MSYYIEREIWSYYIEKEEWRVVLCCLQCSLRALVPIVPQHCNMACSAFLQVYTAQEGNMLQSDLCK